MHSDIFAFTWVCALFLYFFFGICLFYFYMVTILMHTTKKGLWDHCDLISRNHNLTITHLIIHVAM